MLPVVKAGKVGKACLLRRATSIKEDRTRDSVETTEQETNTTTAVNPLVMIGACTCILDEKNLRIQSWISCIHKIPARYGRASEHKAQQSLRDSLHVSAPQKQKYCRDVQGFPEQFFRNRLKAALRFPKAVRENEKQGMRQKSHSSLVCGRWPLLVNFSILL